MSRKRIGLYYNLKNNEEVALVIYIQNLIKGFKLIEEENRPVLIMLTGEDTPSENIEAIRSINYTPMEWYTLKKVNYTLAERVLNKVWRIFFKKNLIIKKDLGFPDDLDFFYPHQDLPESGYIKNRIYWIADYQQKYLTQFFSEEELYHFDLRVRKIAASPQNTLVSSSKTAESDFKKFYSPYKNKLFVLKFVSFIDLPDLDESVLFKQYGIERKYFIISNQFWPHKNHLVVFKALTEVVKAFPNILIVCTGKLSSYRDPEYAEKLQYFIKENNLEDNVKFLGFVPRDHQLVLIKNSVSVIQPSLFEGWSTIVEDVKALNHFLILSDIDVHKEQIERNCIFFERNNALDLAKKITGLLELNRIPIENYNYLVESEKLVANLKSLFSIEGR